MYKICKSLNYVENNQLIATVLSNQEILEKIMSNIHSECKFGVSHLERNADGIVRVRKKHAYLAVKDFPVFIPWNRRVLVNMEYNILGHYTGQFSVSKCNNSGKMDTLIGTIYFTTPCPNTIENDSSPCLCGYPPCNFRIFDIHSGRRSPAESKHLSFRILVYFLKKYNQYCSLDMLE